jgi:hypothetical protein
MKLSRGGHCLDQCCTAYLHLIYIVNPIREIVWPMSPIHTSMCILQVDSRSWEFSINRPRPSFVYLNECVLMK